MCLLGFVGASMECTPPHAHKCQIPRMPSSQLQNRALRGSQLQHGKITWSISAREPWNEFFGKLLPGAFYKWHLVYWPKSFPEGMTINDLGGGQRMLQSAVGMTHVLQWRKFSKRKASKNIFLSISSSPLPRSLMVVPQKKGNFQKVSSEKFLFGEDCTLRRQASCFL